MLLLFLWGWLLLFSQSSNSLEPPDVDVVVVVFWVLFGSFLAEIAVELSSACYIDH